MDVITGVKYSVVIVAYLVNDAAALSPDASVVASYKPSVTPNALFVQSLLEQMVGIISH